MTDGQAIAIIFTVGPLLAGAIIFVINRQFDRERRASEKEWAERDQRNRESWWVYQGASPIHSLIEDGNPLPPAPPVPRRPRASVEI